MYYVLFITIIQLNYYYSLFLHISINFFYMGISPFICILLAICYRILRYIMYSSYEIMDFFYLDILLSFICILLVI